MSWIPKDMSEVPQEIQDMIRQDNHKEWTAQEQTDLTASEMKETEEALLAKNAEKIRILTKELELKRTELAEAEQRAYESDIPETTYNFYNNSREMYLDRVKARADEEVKRLHAYRDVQMQKYHDNGVSPVDCAPLSVKDYAEDNIDYLRGLQKEIKDDRVLQQLPQQPPTEQEPYDAQLEYLESLNRQTVDENSPDQLYLEGLEPDYKPLLKERLRDTQWQNTGNIEDEGDDMCYLDRIGI